jgi:uncharacterized protein (TIGR02186 family)
VKRAQDKKAVSRALSKGQGQIWPYFMPMIIGLLGIMGAVFAVHLPVNSALAQALVADLTRHLVAINTDFRGEEVVLFGAIETAGDVVVVVEGPPVTMQIREKHRRFGLWLNQKPVEFADVPAFYAMASSNGVETQLSPSVRAFYELGLDYIKLSSPPNLSAPSALRYRQALIALKTAQQLYQPKVEPVRFLAAKLFQVRLYFPANVPTGLYRIRTYLVQGGKVVDGVGTAPSLQITKAGLSALIFEFAHYEPFLYALLAVMGAIFAGWLASLAFRRV